MLYVFLIISLFFLNGISYSQQKIQDFYLSNYKNEGLKDWEVKGNEATVWDSYVEIDGVEAKYFQKNDIIDIKADKAKLDKTNMELCLEKNVRINNSQGLKLNTEFLNWKQHYNSVSTDKEVELVRDESLKVNAKGLEADTKLKQISFQEEVKVALNDNREMTTITCDGPLEIDYNRGEAIFNNKVVVENPNGKLLSDKAIVYFDMEKKRILKIVAIGDVKIIRDDNVTFAEQATYSEDTGKMVLEGRPRLIIFPHSKTDLFTNKDKNENSGN
ncbi:MAG: LPS export ABC transporter periplasmic protein LptC [Candidatus Omnitrophica bacterium]|nr:LPS export ABC transporter periplasmic protein LptC [Candidatus Omnitrophota bacterium]